MKTLLEKFKSLEAINNHNEAIKLLVDNFGSDEDKKTMSEIISRSNRRGYTSNDDCLLQSELNVKYYKFIKPMSEK